MDMSPSGQGTPLITGRISIVGSNPTLSTNGSIAQWLVQASHKRQISVRFTVLPPIKEQQFSWLEYLPVTQVVVGSSPICFAIKFLWSVHLMVRISPFHGEYTSSNLVQITNIFNSVYFDILNKKYNIYYVILKHNYILCLLKASDLLTSPFWEQQ